MSQLSEKIDIKDYSTMVSDTLDKIVDSGVGISNTQPGSIVRTLVESVLDNNDMTNYYLEYVYKSMGIDTATGSDLDRLVEILGIIREDATSAIGTVTFTTGDEPYIYDIPIPFGFKISTVQNNDGSVVEFMVTDTDAILKAGSTSIIVNIKAVVPCKLYLPANTITVMNASIVGIQSVTNTEEINSGTNDETDAELRIRSKKIVKSFGKCTTTAIKMSIENVDGVASCVVKDMYNDVVGTIAIIVAPIVYPVPESVKNEVETTLKDTKAAGIYYTIIYPTIKNITIDLTITGDFVVNDVLKAVSDYIATLEVGQTFVIKQMERMILNAIDSDFDGETDLTTNTPIENVTATETEIIKATSVTINGVAHDV